MRVDFISDTTVLLAANRRYVDGNPYYGFNATAKVVDLETGELLLSADIPAEESQSKLLENNSYFSHIIPFKESFKSYNISTGEFSIGSLAGLDDEIYWLGDGGSYRVNENTLTKLTADNKFGFNYVFDYPYPISVTLIDYTDTFIKAQVSSKHPFDYPDEIVGIKIIQGSTPTDINLSELAFSENIDGNSSIASMSSIDADTGDAFSYELVSGRGDSDNDFFSINVDQLMILVAPDFEIQSSYSIRLQTMDSEGLTFEKAFTLEVNDINEPPEDLSLTNVLSSISENSDTTAAIKVADLLITDDGLGTNTLSLSGADAAFFEISNGALFLKAGTALDYETKSFYAFKVSASDPALTGTIPVNTDYSLAINKVIISKKSKILSDGQFNLKLTGKKNIKGIGNNLDNQITGNKGKNLLKGLSGDDILIGGSGKDNLQGGAGDDIIDGGIGKDKLKGGPGADTYMASNGTDTIIGFNIEQGDLLSGFGDTSGLDISDSGKFCIVSGNGYKAKLKGIDAVDLIRAMESIFV